MFRFAANIANKAMPKSMTAAPISRGFGDAWKERGQANESEYFNKVNSKIPTPLEQL